MCKCIPLSVVILALHQLCASRILLVQLQSFEHFLDMVAYIHFQRCGASNGYTGLLTVWPSQVNLKGFDDNRA